jgi:mannosyltransferase OCH1-like enzyme
MNSVVQSLWIGTELSTMERLSLSSFLRCGHRVHLYVYRDLPNVPRGVTLCDANEILPASAVFQYPQHKSYAGFANFFRYKLLMERGGWWVDTDTVCLKPFDFSSEYVFPTEWTTTRGSTISAAPLKTPPDSAVMRYAWRTCESKDTQKLVWGETGPRLISDAVRTCTLEQYIVAPSVFCPIPYYEWNHLLDPARVWEFGADTCAIHLWNEMWRRSGTDKDARYHPECLYEQFKAKFLDS